MLRYKWNVFWILFILCVSWIGYSGVQVIVFSFEDETRKADAAIILGAAVWGEEPSPVFKERIHHGIQLYQDGYVKKIIFTGGKSDEGERAESEVARQYALNRGVSGKDILIETESTITEENLSYAFEVARKNQLESFLIVSDPLHMKRAMSMADDYGMQAYSSPTKTSAYKSFSTKVSFFMREWFYYMGYQLTVPFQ